MSRVYDFYSEFEIKSVEDIYNLTHGKKRFSEIEDVYSRIELFLNVIANKNLKPYAQTGKLSRNLQRTHRKYENKAGLKKVIHDCRMYDEYIKKQFGIMKILYLIPKTPDISSFFKSSFFLQINFKLKKPFISADDTPFYIIENPMRKDKVFKIPVMSSTSWKGNLRWVMAKILLIDRVKDVSDEEFAEERLKLSLLFGTEKGIEEDKSWAKYFRELKPKADDICKKKLKKWFSISDEKPEPCFMGRLRFYPTFFNKIDLMVINPHDRQTKTGRNPVYVECVLEGTEGEFSLLYTPFDIFGRNGINIAEEIKKDIEKITKGIKAMFYKYGFSAKKSSGFGTALPVKEEDIKLNPESDEIKKVIMKNLVEGKNG